MPSEFFITCGISIVSLVYLCLVLIMFVIKGNTSRTASKYYFWLSVTAVVSMIILIVAGVFAVNGKNSIATFLARIHVFITVEWLFLLAHYFSIAFKPDNVTQELMKKNSKGSLISVIVVTFINILACAFLDFSFSQSAARHAFVMGGILDIYY